MSPNTRTILLLATLLVTCLPSSYADLIGDVCAKASNPSSCDKILRSNPHAVQAKDIPSLGSVTIDIAQDYSKSAEVLANSLAGTTTDPNLKFSLSTCVHNFDYATMNLYDCVYALSVKDKEALSKNALGASANANICNGNFVGLVEPPNVEQAIQNIQDACDAILAISKVL